MGIYSGPSVDRSGLDSERPELPVDLKKQFVDFKDFLRVFGDFEVCPLEPEKEGVMQAACIESAKNIVAGGPFKPSFGLSGAVVSIIPHPPSSGECGMATNSLLQFLGAPYAICLPASGPTD